MASCGCLGLSEWRGGERGGREEMRMREEKEEEEGEGGRKKHCQSRTFTRSQIYFANANLNYSNLANTTKKPKNRSTPYLGVVRCLETGLSFGLMMSPAALCVEFPYPNPSTTKIKLLSPRGKLTMVDIYCVIVMIITTLIYFPT